jgi:inner membrane protein
MLFRTHFVFALFVYFIFFKFLEISFLDKVFFGVFLLIATLFVDIDSTKSKLGSYWIFRPFQLFFSHRGMIHSFLVASVLSLMIYFFNISAGIGFFIGYCCHLLLDFFTRRGIFLFWPFYKKKFYLFGFSSGGLIEEIIFVLLLLCDAFLVVFLFFNIEF